MTDSSSLSRQAVYTALSGATAVTDIVGTRIYSGTALSDTAFPYIVIGERSTDRRYETKDETIQSHRLRIYGYVRGVSATVGIENLKAAIFNALHKQTLAAPGARFVDCVQEGLDDTSVMEDGRTYRAIVDILITIQ